MRAAQGAGQAWGQGEAEAGEGGGGFSMRPGSSVTKNIPSMTSGAVEGGGCGDEAKRPAKRRGAV